MRTVNVSATVLFAVLLSLAAAQPAAAQFYAERDLVSDTIDLENPHDPQLINPWGLVSSPTSPWWVSDNGADVSTLYNGEGVKQSRVVSVPGGPTGVVFNGGSGFVVSDGTHSAASLFIFATESGSILGWNPGVGGGTAAVAGVPANINAVYKGLAIALGTPAGDVLYATNFHSGRVDVFDSSFHPITVPGEFDDPRLPDGYAPFGIRNIDGVIYVTYALQDIDRHDDVPGKGHGFVNAFDTSGNLLRRVASRGTLDSPWGLALAPDDFGSFSNHLLVGNFGDGRIHGFKPFGPTVPGTTFHPYSPLRDTHAQPIQIEGLWALAFGNGANAGNTNTLFFTAGPGDEHHGLFGTLVPAPRAPIERPTP